MLCVLEVKIINIPIADFFKMRGEQPKDSKPFSLRSIDAYEAVQSIEEIIHGKIFVNAHGDKVCIGMAKDVQAALGLPFEALSNMEVNLDKSNLSLSMARKDAARLEAKFVAKTEEIKTFHEASFLHRLRWAFLGGWL